MPTVIIALLVLGGFALGVLVGRGALPRWRGPDVEAAFDRRFRRHFARRALRRQAAARRAHGTEREAEREAVRAAAELYLWS